MAAQYCLILSSVGATHLGFLNRHSTTDLQPTNRKISNDGSPINHHLIGHPSAAILSVGATHLGFPDRHSPTDLQPTNRKISNDGSPMYYQLGLSPNRLSPRSERGVFTSLIKLSRTIPKPWQLTPTPLCYNPTQRCNVCSKDL